MRRFHRTHPVAARWLAAGLDALTPGLAYLLGAALLGVFPTAFGFVLAVLVAHLYGLLPTRARHAVLAGVGLLLLALAAPGHALAQAMEDTANYPGGYVLDWREALSPANLAILVPLVTRGFVRGLTEKLKGLSRKYTWLPTIEGDASKWVSFAVSGLLSAAVFWAMGKYTNGVTGFLNAALSNFVAALLGAYGAQGSFESDKAATAAAEAEAALRKAN